LAKTGHSAFNVYTPDAEVLFAVFTNMVYYDEKCVFR
jgi:hypothetical protein